MQTDDAAIAEMVERLDDWTNLFQRERSTRDKANGLAFIARAELTREQLANLYKQNALAARIVDRMPDDSMRAGYKIVAEGVDPVALKSQTDDLGLDAAVDQADKWSRLYGGALLCMPTTDYDPHTGEIRKPYEPMGKVAQMFRPFVVPAHDARPLDWDDVFGSPTYHQALSYQISGMSGQSVRLHHSRCIPFEPVKLDPAMLRLHSLTGWGPSILDRCFEALARYGASLKHGTSMMYIASIMTMQLAGYKEEYKTKEGREVLKRYTADLFNMLDSRGLLVLDKDDAAGSTTVNTTGTTDVIDRNRDALAADAEMPKEILFNESPAGLNAGELSGPQEIWFGRCATHQEKDLTPALDRLHCVFFEARGMKVDEWDTEWAPLWTKSEDGQAETATKWANVDKVYFDMGADGEEIIRQRLVEGATGPLSFKTSEAENGTPLDLSPDDLAATEAASAAPAAGAASTVADTAMNGAQISSMLEIMKSVNIGELTYEQGIGALGTAFVNLRGREATILGPKPAVAPVNPKLAPQPGTVPGQPGVAAAPGADGEELEHDPMNGPSDDPIPADVMSPKEAATKYRVPTRTINRMIESNAIRYWGLPPHVRVSLADIAKAARSHEGGSKPGPDGSDAEQHDDRADDMKWIARVADAVAA